MAVLALLAMHLFCQQLYAEPVVSLTDWTSLVFSSETRYSPQPHCVLAEADNSASSLLRNQRVTLANTPWLAWGWRADQAASGQRDGIDEQSRAGDDFRARVYVIYRGGSLARTRALNYVWSAQYPPGSHWPNPYASRSIMVVVQRGAAAPDQWHYFIRDVKADFRRYHGIEIDQVDALAVMTDSDNRGGTVSTCFDLPRFIPAVINLLPSVNDGSP